MRTSNRKRMGIWLICAVAAPVVAAFAWGSSHAQGPGGPPFGPGGPPFGPRGPSRPPGIPDFPRPPGIPDIPRPPDMPRGPGRSGGLFEHVWTCSHCGKELGRSSSGIDRPPYDSCPYCGAKFMNNIGGKFQRPGSSFRPSDGGPPPSHQQPPGGFAPPSNSGGPGAPPNSGQPPGGPSGGFGPGRDGSPDADVNEEEPAFPEDSDLPSTGTQGSFSSLRLWLLVGGLVVLMLAGGAGGVVLILIGMKRRKPARASKRRRQRRGYEYEEVSY